MSHLSAQTVPAAFHLSYAGGPLSSANVISKWYFSLRSVRRYALFSDVFLVRSTARAMATMTRQTIKAALSSTASYDGFDRRGVIVFDLLRLLFSAMIISEIFRVSLKFDRYFGRCPSRVG